MCMCVQYIPLSTNSSSTNIWQWVMWTQRLSLDHKRCVKWRKSGACMCVCALVFSCNFYLYLCTPTHTQFARNAAAHRVQETRIATTNKEKCFMSTAAQATTGHLQSWRKRTDEGPKRSENIRWTQTNDNNTQPANGWTDRWMNERTDGWMGPRL